MWRAALASRKTHVLLALAAAWLGWQLWLTVAAGGKIGDLPTTDRVNIVVTLSFPPERFHVQLLQSFGRVSGAEDNAVEVRGVKRSELRAVARPYWVRRIEPLKSGG
jgi:hypothetical protein